MVWMANSTQGLAVLVFLVAFTCLSLGLFAGSGLMLLLFVVGLGGSLALFLKAKAITASGK
ncbi:MAG: hypothetical protein M3O78_07570 [Chloroflexota bacterium]|nr:hypothetical protein [Chloroflexota bacterium]